MKLAATGHRPSKLGGLDVTDRLRRLARDYLVTSRPDEVISGMALGWDMAWAEAALELGIPLIAAVPFRGQEVRWPDSAQRRYHSVLRRAEVVIVSNGGYSPFKMQARNRWMVERCDKVVALWNGSPGGTANCIAIANVLTKPVDNLWREFSLDGQL